MNLKIIILLFFFITQLSLFAQNKDEKSAKKERENSAQFLDGFKQRQLGNPDEAIRIYEADIEKYPDDDAAMFYLAELYANKQDFVLALQMAKKAVELKPNNEWYRLLLVDIYLASGDLDSMTKEMESLVELYPENLDFFNQLAVAYIRNNNYQSAIDVFNQLEKRTRISEEISMQKVKLYQLMGKEKKAFREIKKLINTNPQATRYHAILAEMYMSANMKENALKEYLTIKKLDPQDEYIDLSIADFYQKKGDQQKATQYLLDGFTNSRLDIDTKIQILLSFYKISENQPELTEKAFKLLEVLIETHPNDPKAWSVYADFYAREEKWIKTRDAYRKVISLDSSRFVVWQQLLFAESEIGETQALADESKRAFRLFPVQPLPYLFNGIANYQLKNEVLAIQSLERGKDFVYDNPIMLEQFLLLLGDAYHSQGNDKKSFEYYEKVLKINPSNSFVLNNYAYYLSLKNEQLEKAEKMALRAVQLDTENPSNQDTYGWVLFKNSKYSEAKMWIEKAVNLSPNATLYEHYGDVLYKLGETNKAIEYWQKAKDSDSSGKETSEFLNKKLIDKTYYE